MSVLEGGGLIATVAREARGHPYHSAGLLLFTALVGAGSFGIPLALERALEAATSVEPAGEAALWGGLVALAALGVLRGCASWGRDTILRRLRARRVAAIDREIVEQALELEAQSLDELGPGPGGAADAVAAGDRIAGFLFGDLPATLAEAATAIALLALLFSFDWRMGCLGLVLAVWNAVAVWRMTQSQARVFEARARSEAELAGGGERDLGQIEAIKLGALEAPALAKWLDLLDRRTEALAAGLKRGEAIGARQAAVAAATQAAVLGAGGALIALEPGFGIGDLFACLTLIFGVNDPARRLLDAHADASRASVELLRRYRLRTVSAGATPSPDIALPPNSRIRLAEADPAAWRTLADRIEGAALIDGPAQILPGTFAENVALFRPVDADRMTTALEVARLAGTAGRRAAGERLYPGVESLSTGQRVRLAVARAVYDEAPTILFARGLENLDRATAQELLRRLDATPAALVVADGPVAASALETAPLANLSALADLAETGESPR